MEPSRQSYTPTSRASKLIMADYFSLVRVLPGLRRICPRRVCAGMRRLCAGYTPPRDFDAASTVPVGLHATCGRAQRGSACDMRRYAPGLLPRARAPPLRAVMRRVYAPRDFDAASAAPVGLHATCGWACAGSTWVCAGMRRYAPRPAGCAPRAFAMRLPGCINMRGWTSHTGGVDA